MKFLAVVLTLGCMTEVSGFQIREDAATVRRSPGAPMAEADAGIDVKEQDSRVPGDSGVEMPGGSDIRSFLPETVRDHSVPDASPDIGVSVDGPIVLRDGPIVASDAVILPPDATPAPDASPDVRPPDTVPACPAGAIGRCERFPERGCSSDNDCGACANGPAQGRYCPTVGASASACGWCEGSSVATYCTFGGSECGGLMCRAGSCGPSRCIPCGGP